MSKELGSPAELVKTIAGYEFQNNDLLQRAFTHASYSNEHPEAESYERLEILGDAVLDLTVVQYLFERPEHFDEGDISMRKAQLVCEESLSKIAVELDLNRFIRVGKSIRDKSTHALRSISADCIEALIGAVFIDCGKNFQTAESFVLNLYNNFEDSGQIEWKDRSLDDSKGSLVHEASIRGLGQVEYFCLGEKGPDHKKSFHMGTYINNKLMDSKWGNTKKSATQKSAKFILDNKLLDTLTLQNDIDLPDNKQD